MPDCPQCNAQPTSSVPEHVRIIAARDATIILRDATIALQSADIAGLTDTLAQRNAKIIDMQNEIDGLECEIDGLYILVDGFKRTIERWEANWPKNTCPKCGYTPKELSEGVEL